MATGYAPEFRRQAADRAPSPRRSLRRDPAQLAEAGGSTRVSATGGPPTRGRSWCDCSKRAAAYFAREHLRLRFRLSVTWPQTALPSRWPAGCCASRPRATTSGGTGPLPRGRGPTPSSAQIVEIHALARGTYGAPRVHAELRLRRGVRCGRKRWHGLMPRASLCELYRRRGKRQRPLPPVPDHLVRRRFTADAPDRLWLTSITEHPTREGKVSARRCWTSTRDAWSAGRSPTTGARSSWWTRLRWCAGDGSRRQARP